LIPVHSTHTLTAYNCQRPLAPDISDAAAQSVAGYTGLMLAQTVAHTNRR